MIVGCWGNGALSLPAHATMKANPRLFYITELSWSSRLGRVACSDVTAVQIRLVAKLVGPVLRCWSGGIGWCPHHGEEPVMGPPMNAALPSCRSTPGISSNTLESRHPVRLPRELPAPPIGAAWLKAKKPSRPDRACFVARAWGRSAWAPPSALCSLYTVRLLPLPLVSLPDLGRASSPPSLD